MALSDNIVEIVKTMPGIDSHGVHELVEASMPVVKQTLVDLYRKGVLVRKLGPSKNGGSKSGRRPYVYRINPDPSVKPAPEMTQPQKRRKYPTDAGLQARLDAANERVAELEAWKAVAIERFPDLKVEPIILKARKIVAQQLRDMGDTTHAQQIERGYLDDKPLMQVALRALEA